MVVPRVALGPMCGSSAAAATDDVSGVQDAVPRSDVYATNYGSQPQPQPQSEPQQPSQRDERVRERREWQREEQQRKREQEHQELLRREAQQQAEQQHRLDDQVRHQRQQELLLRLSMAEEARDEATRQLEADAELARGLAEAEAVRRPPPAPRSLSPAAPPSLSPPLALSLALHPPRVCPSAPPLVGALLFDPPFF
jgi:membrane protein involved in colicin uptake